MLYLKSDCIIHFNYDLFGNSMKQKLPRYEMHKYWGKKPPQDLARLLEKYTKVNDLVFDPFSGYGVFACEAILLGRKAISHDLNPVATFIQEQLLNQDIDLKKFKIEIETILSEVEKDVGSVYQTICPLCNCPAPITASLRTKEDVLLVNKISCDCSRAAIEKNVDDSDLQQIKDIESHIEIPEHPNTLLIRNGRISAKDGMYTDHLFTKRALLVHTKIWKKLKEIDDPNIRNLALFAFTSNLANCSRLVPPIKSRGAMSAGAWMTGFYTGETYIENNVLHYFKNRFKKVLSGKKDFLSSLNGRVDKVEDINDLYVSSNGGYAILNGDAKKLTIQDETVDYIFTDFPYGDSVPYFEQSILWNTWLNFDVQYQEEIVISDSKQREKNQVNFAKDIRQAVEEIYRVLKFQSYFTFTFHSLEGREWYALIKSCLECGFIIENIEEMTQKTLPPRQLNRAVTIKGDMLVTFKKVNKNREITYLSEDQTLSCFDEIIQSDKSFSENYSLLVQYFFKNSLIFNEINMSEEILKRMK